ncbi:MAG: hypothetical protein ABIT01_17460 [Thermoanaerobaculia bacterium]
MSSRLLVAACLSVAVSAVGISHRADAQNGARSGRGAGGLSVRTTTFNNGLGFGARAMGMAGAFTAIADDASAASWNPAGLGQLIRPEVTLVGGFNKATVDTTNASQQFFNEGTTSLYLKDVDNTVDAKSSGVDFFSFAQPFKLGRQLFTAQISYARNARPLNATESTRTDFFDRPGGTNLAPDLSDSTVSSFGGYDSIGLGFGTGFDEKLYIGFTVNYWTGSTSTSTETRFRSLVNAPGGGQAVFADFTTETFDEQRYNGLSASVGILVKPSSKFSVGLTYRGGWSGSDVYESRFDQHGVYTFDPAQQPLPFRASGAQTSNGTLSWPGTLGGGFAFRPIEALTLALDGSITQWGQASISRVPTARYDGNCTVAAVTNCPITFTESSVKFPSQVGDSSVEQNNQTAFRFGVEYVLRPGNLIIPLRAGAYRIRTIAPLYDESDQDPDVNFNGVTAGIGFAFPLGNGSLLFDAAGVFDRASTNRNSDVVVDRVVTQRLTGDRKVTNSRFIGSIIYRF